MAILSFLLLFFNSLSLAETNLLLRKTKTPEGRLVFSYTLKDNSDIYSINFTNREVRKLISSKGDDSFPRWSPDGTQLLFQSDASGNREIYKAFWNGKNVVRLTKSPGTDGEPDWSPDGKEIVFSSSRSGNGTNLFTMNEDGSNVKPITNTAHKHFYPRWSPRGDQILLTANIEWPGWDVSILDLSTLKIEPLSKGLSSFTRGDWNLDGSKIIFSYGGGTSTNIYEATKGDTTARQLTKRLGMNYDAIWLHDNKSIFFVGELSPGSSNFQLFMLDTSTGNIDQLTDGPGSIRHLSWTPFPELQS